VVRRFGFLFGPRWLALHVVVVAACVTMVLLGRWQWHVAHVHHGSIQNYSYAFQWWAFTAFAVFMWLRLVHDAAPPPTAARSATDEAGAVRQATPTAPEPAEVPYRRYVMPSSATSSPVAADAEHAAYNAYLARLAAQSSAKDDE
jgi:DNA-binding transcriptional regulator of glucitol operon